MTATDADRAVQGDAQLKVGVNMPGEDKIYVDKELLVRQTAMCLQMEQDTRVGYSGEPAQQHEKCL
jgi:hypothetical protein